MDSEPSLDALVAALRADVTSGATALADHAATLVARAARTLEAGSADELRGGLASLTRRVLDAQPAMAPLVTLVREVLLACEPHAMLDEVRTRGAEAAESFAHRLESAAQAVARNAQEILPDRGRVATVSSSGTVLAALLVGARGKTLRVLCFESRPSNEGRALAATLSDRGLEVDYAVDAATHALAPECGVVLIGADSIGDVGIVNKIGSAGLVAAARESSVPVYALADTTKLLPIGWRQRLDDDRPAPEVWEDAPQGVRVWNRYFEAVPTAWLDGIVTERGVLDAAGIKLARQALRVPEALSGRRPSRR